MQFLTTLALLSASASLSTALPAPARAPTHTARATNSTPPAEFYLVTSSQSTPSKNSSELKDVSATTPYNPVPLATSPMLLRLLAPGYNYLTTFSLAASTSVLSTTFDFHNVPKTFSAGSVANGSELALVDTPVEQGSFAVSTDGLLTLGGDAEGWRICVGATGEETVWWKGAAEGCRQTYVHVVSDAPYLRKRDV